ncbi:hypothetical protein [Demequina gelatinilytica]|uniref:hypothetical protein n=1 Tax=Demequina gelatinilytica TaxID=1638980 RepID=UPI000A77916E|nr:hypothetical protein [Demequina gelatinilytica]
MLDDISDAEKTSNGGATLMENSDDAVIATGPRPASAVITATPDGWSRNSAFNASGLTPGSPPSTTRSMADVDGTVDARDSPI